MTQAELLRYLVDVFEGLGVEYMIGGSQASMYYGEPRLTRDVDVVVGLPLEDLPGFLGRFPPEASAVPGSRRVFRAAGGRHPLQVGPELDEQYIGEWADRLGLRKIWEQIRRQAE